MSLEKELRASALAVLLADHNRVYDILCDAIFDCEVARRSGEGLTSSTTAHVAKSLDEARTIILTFINLVHDHRLTEQSSVVTPRRE